MWALVRLLAVLACGSKCIGVNVVSIVDATSVSNAFVKIHSIVRFSRNPTYLRFGLLVFESEGFRLSSVEEMLKCFNSSQFTTIAWKPPLGLPDLLLHDKFETELIFSRFYLPNIFPAFARFLYLDNDVIVNTDLSDLFNYPLKVWSSFNEHLVEAGPTLRRDFNHQGPHIKIVGEAVAGFVFERHNLYRQYFANHFNLSSPLVKKIVGAANPDVFLNAGVFLVNAEQWRNRHCTERAVELLLEHRRNGPLFSSSAGDQGLFYLLLQGQMAFLPAKFNMRRLPRHSMAMLKEGVDGVVHFAGVFHGDQLQLCRYPLLHPSLQHAALPLYLSVVASLIETCPTVTEHRIAPRNDSLASLCPPAITSLKSALAAQPGVLVVFRGDRAGFQWPPASPS